MIQGFYSARAGLHAHQEHMNVIANNMANVSTVGYKPMRVSFSDLMYQNINRETAEETAMLGHGAKIAKTDGNTAAGPLSATNSWLDFAIPGEGYFALENAAGERSYTRAGNFILSADEAGAFWLAAPNGDRVLDGQGNGIQITMDEQGTPQLDPKKLGVFTFSNPYGLLSLGNNRVAQTEVSGEAAALENPELLVGYLEGSGVDLSTEMVKVIESQRAFGFSSKMIQVADEIEQTINNLR